MQNKKISVGITFGVYDLLHEGHKTAIRFCQDKCELLYIGVYTDYWVQVQKGHEGRPYETYALRVSNLKRWLDEEWINAKIIKMDTLDIDRELRFADKFFLGIEQKNMRWNALPYIEYIPYTEGISTTQILEDKK